MILQGPELCGGRWRRGLGVEGSARSSSHLHLLAVTDAGHHVTHQREHTVVWLSLCYRQLLLCMLPPGVIHMLSKCQCWLLNHWPGRQCNCPQVNVLMVWHLLHMLLCGPWTFTAVHGSHPLSVYVLCWCDKKVLFVYSNVRVCVGVERVWIKQKHKNISQTGYLLSYIILCLEQPPCC